MGVDALTKPKVGLDVLLPDIRSHGDNGDLRGDHPDHGCSRHAVKVGHDYIHEYEIEALRVLVHFFHSFETVALRKNSKSAVLHP